VSLIGLLQHLQILPFPIPIISVPGSTFINRNIAAEAIAVSLRSGWRRWPGAGARAPGRGCSCWCCGSCLGATRCRGAWLGAASKVAVFYLLRHRVVPRALAGGLAWRRPP
jgi:hypothetical protein